MSFESLSNELIADIFKHLERSDCLHISFCCHVFRDIAEPFLYASFVQRKREDLGLFLRSLMEKPYRAKYLKHFTSTLITSEDYRNKRPEEFNLSAYLNEPLRRQWILDQLPKSIFWPSITKSWQVHICNDIYWDPICAFVLWICSENLQSVKMHSYGLEIPDMINHMFQQVRTARQNPALPNPFPKLRNVELSECEERQYISFNSMFSYLQLNTVKEFVGRQIAPDVSSDELVTMDEMRLKTESLSLQTSQIRSRVMVEFCMCFTELKKFHYDHKSFSTRMERLWPSAITKGLQNSKHCLEELILSAKAERWSPIPARPEYLLGLSSDFESLKVLDVSSRALFGMEFDNTGVTSRMIYELGWTREVFRSEYVLDNASCQLFASSLPPKLEYLIIRECTAAIYNFLEILVSGDEHRIGSLKKLKVEFFPGFLFGDWWERRWYNETVRRGIEVEVNYPQLTPSTTAIELDL